MFEKCAACESRILAGATSFLHWRFCNDACCTRFKSQLADELIPAEVISAQVESVFHAPCPQCGRATENDFYSATKITGMLLAYHIESGSVLCCASCGRKNRMMAALHCLFLGWWSPRAAFCNVFVLPTNLVATLFIRRPEVPSEMLSVFVKSRLVDSMQNEIAGALASTENANENKPTSSDGQTAN